MLIEQNMSRRFFLYSLLFISSLLQVVVVQSQNWEKLTFLDNPGPSPRVFAASANGSPVPPPYSPFDTSGIVIFGGTSNPTTYSPSFNDLWVLNAQDNHADGRAWFEIPIAPFTSKPPPRSLAAVAMDSKTGYLYLYGGFDGINWYSDFWTINMSVIHEPGLQGEWNEIKRERQPPLLCGMSFNWNLVSSGLDNELILFGGGDNKRQLYNSIWLYSFYEGDDDWSEYTQGSTKLWAPAREFHATWVDNSANVWIFGGYDYGYSYLNDTWYFHDDNHNGRFTNTEPTIVPPSRCHTSAAYSPNSDGAMIFGGQSDDQVFGDSWYWNGSNWKQLPPEEEGSGPSPRYGMVSGYYPQGDGLIIFGGVDSTGVVNNETWFFPYSAIPFAKDSY